jgi:hypothetical protein
MSGTYLSSMWTVFHRERKEAEAEDDEDEREEVFS